MASHAAASHPQQHRRNHVAFLRRKPAPPPAPPTPAANGNPASCLAPTLPVQAPPSEERTVKKLRLPKALTFLLYEYIIKRYKDDEGDRVLLATDSDLITAIELARSVEWKVLRLHLDEESEVKTESSLPSVETSRAQQITGWSSSLRLGIMPGAVAAAAVAGVGIITAYSRRSEL